MNNLKFPRYTIRTTLNRARNGGAKIRVHITYPDGSTGEETYWLVEHDILELNLPGGKQTKTHHAKASLK